jgi:hypothetical protein
MPHVPAIDMPEIYHFDIADNISVAGSSHSIIILLHEQCRECRLIVSHSFM